MSTIYPQHNPPTQALSCLFNSLQNSVVIAALFSTLMCAGCNVDVTISTSGPDDGESLSYGPDTYTTGTDTNEDTSTTTTSTSGVDSTTGEGTPCHDATPAEGAVISECCPESIGNCNDWCADHGFGECLETIVSVGDAMCGMSVSHEDFCGIDVFDVIVASELSVQCVCAQPDGTGSGTTASTDSTTGGCEQMPIPEDQPECVPCNDSSGCRADEECICSSEFGSGVCLPTTWDECMWAPCDERCLYVDGGWICALPSC